MSEPIFKPYDVSKDAVHPATLGKKVPNVVFNEENAVAKELNDAWSALNSQHEIHTAKLGAPDSKWAESPEGKAAVQNLKETGGRFETVAAKLQGELEASKEAAKQAYEAGVSKAKTKAEINALAKTRDETLKRIQGEQEHLTQFRTEAKTMGGHDHIGGGPSGAMENPATSAVSSTVSTGSKIYRNTPEAVKLGVIGEAEYAKNTNFVTKLIADAKAKINIASIDKNGVITESKTLGKIGKVATAGVGAVISGYGLKDLGQVMGIIGADTDEKGQEIPADGGKLFKAAAELAGGAGIVYLSIIRGGRDLAKGIGK